MFTELIPSIAAQAGSGDCPTSTSRSISGHTQVTTRFTKRKSQRCQTHWHGQRSRRTMTDQKTHRASSDGSSDATWEPPIVERADMEFTVDDVTPDQCMEIEEHIALDQLVVDIYTGLRKTWPSVEDVVNDVDVATTLLCLTVLTPPRKIPLRREWFDVTNIRRLAEQKRVRNYLAVPVHSKKFARMRSLCLWYEGYSCWL